MAGFHRLAAASTICFALAACGSGSDDSGLSEASIPQEDIAVAAEAVQKGPFDTEEAVTSEPGTAMLSWDATPNSNVVGYRVYFGTASGAYEQPSGAGVPAGNANAFKVENLPSGQTYYFAVTAIDEAGGESGFSTEVTRTIP